MTSKRSDRKVMGSAAEKRVREVHGAERRHPNYSRWRAISLLSVYLLIAVHIAHWKMAGSTLAPLELNEVMYTLELGVMTAGFIFMAVAFVSAAFFGRFFCSWMCHILALEDSSAWLLGKFKIRPRPVRSRVLLLVPPGAMFYMFAWPHLLRYVQGLPRPPFRVLSDADGWASFVTDNFWRNLPGPWVAAATFAVCGFAIVYFLGSRSFCTYACPYGVVFGLADRVAVGRIVSVGDCAQCGKCTAACQSHIRVHEELAQFGKVVNPACLKDLDCVAACPEGNVAFGFTRPSWFKSWRKGGRFGVPYDFTLLEDVLMASVFLAGLLIFRGLYGAVPFLMTLGIGPILAFIAIMGVRIVLRKDVRVGGFQLKRAGRLSSAGWSFATMAVLIAAFTVHSGFIRYHEEAGGRAYAKIEQLQAGGAQIDPRQIASALSHVRFCERWGLLWHPEMDRRLATLHLLDGSEASAEPYIRRILAREPQDAQSRITLAAILLIQSRVNEAVEQLQAVTRSPATSRTQGGAGDAEAKLRAAAHEMLGNIRAVQGDRASAAGEYQAALEAWPESSTVRSALADLAMTASQPAGAMPGSATGQPSPEQVGGL
jgi:polyferredoxin